MGRNAKLKEKQKWSHEKPKLDNARKLQGIYFIDPEDKEFKETIKNAGNKLETPMAPAMPCKMSKNNQNWVTHGKSKEIISKLACILEASESTRLRMEESLPNFHEDHIAGNGDNSLQHYNLVLPDIAPPPCLSCAFSCVSLGSYTSLGSVLMPALGVCLRLVVKSARVYCGCKPGPTRVALHPTRMVEEPERQPYVRWTTCYDFEETWIIDVYSCTPPRPVRVHDLVDPGSTSTSDC